MSWLYVVVRRLRELVVLIARGDRAKELEILVLRHELSILRRQIAQPRFEPHDRLLLSAFSRVLAPLVERLPGAAGDAAALAPPARRPPLDLCAPPYRTAADRP